MRYVLALIVGIAIGGVAAWYYSGQRVESRPAAAGARTEPPAASMRDTIEDQLRALHLTGSDISNELARTGRVMRQTAQEAGQAIADATAEARTTAAIKARLLRDPELSAWNISVNTTAGVVTLSGSVASAENIGKAMVLALGTPGVRQVISTLQVIKTK